MWSVNLNNIFIRLTLWGILRTVKIESWIAKLLTLTMLNRIVGLGGGGARFSPTA